ncbi:hypothetical protein [Desulfurivibrio dismutans]|uniref:hypothetical protein n=1 Tax=Desulfurivibrio dismutans TaxID=1398908 RepID=UPI0023D97ACD|nr:hypothetical protein [Desulfurivibrio alkaliphilus]MDF1614108.1 hypothetical protein [Desulfurivibrio alkaliphilus]
MKTTGSNSSDWLLGGCLTPTLAGGLPRPDADMQLVKLYEPEKLAGDEFTSFMLLVQIIIAKK